MNIALIGCRGHIGYVFRGLKRLPGVKITAIASGSDDPVEKLAGLCRENGHTPEIFADWEKMLDTAQPDLLCIDGPFERHAEMAAAALDRGVDVFCEKPVALDWTQFARLKKAWQKSGRHIRSMVGLRYADAFLHAYTLIKSGAVGKIKFIRTQKSYKLGSRPDFYRARNTYGGTIPWVGSHALDWIIFYSGAKFSTVTALHEASDNRGCGELEVIGSAIFRMDNGIIADMGIDYLRPEAAPTHGDDRVRIAGTGGILEVSGGKIILTDADGERIIDPPPAERDVFSDFVLELTTGRPALATDEETFDLTAAVLLARDSADSGNTLKFKDLP